MRRSDGFRKSTQRILHVDGGYDFDPALMIDAERTKPLWTPAALPSVLTLIDLPDELAARGGALDWADLGPIAAESGPDRLVEGSNHVFRVHDVGTERPPAGKAVTIPLDVVVEVRVAALLRLSRALTRRDPGPDPAAFTASRRARLALALRVLDGRLQNASYRDIAEAVFGADRMARQAWKTHDLRDRTIRLARYGTDMMHGGYRHLLLYPFRRRL